MSSDEAKSGAANAPIDPTQTHEVMAFEHDRPLTCCRVDPTGRYVFAGAEDLNVYRWEIATGTQSILKGHESWVRSMDFSADSHWLYTVGWDGQLRYWDATATQPETLHTVQAHRGFARWVQVSPAGRMLVTCGNDKFIRVWDERSGSPLLELSGHDRHPYAVCFNPADGMLASQDLMGNVFIWDPRRPKRAETVSTVMTGYDNKFAADMGGARDMQFRADGRLLACAGITNVVNSFAGQQDPIVTIIDWKSKKVTHHLQAKEKKTGVMWGVRFHPEGFLVGAVAQQGGKGDLLFWRLNDAEADSADDKAVAEEKPVELKSFHTTPLAKCARGIDFLPGARRVAVAHSDGHLKIYEMAAASPAKPDSDGNMPAT